MLTENDVKGVEFEKKSNRKYYVAGVIITLVILMIVLIATSYNAPEQDVKEFKEKVNTWLSAKTSEIRKDKNQLSKESSAKFSNFKNVQKICKKDFEIIANFKSIFNKTSYSKTCGIDCSIERNASRFTIIRKINDIKWRNIYETEKAPVSSIEDCVFEKAIELREQTGLPSKASAEEKILKWGKERIKTVSGAGCENIQLLADIASVVEIVLKEIETGHEFIIKKIINNPVSFNKTLKNNTYLLDIINKNITENRQSILNNIFAEIIEKYDLAKSKKKFIDPSSLFGIEDLAKISTCHQSSFAKSFHELYIQDEYNQFLTKLNNKQNPLDNALPILGFELERGLIRS
jgi:ABC-type transporter MlaC component